MRILTLVFALMLTFPAFAEAYQNKRFGFEAKIPAGFQVMGVPSSEGATYRSAGGAILTVYAVPVEGGFEKTASYWIERAHNYDGFAITGQTITPDWAEYAGNIGGRQTRVRMILSCNRQYAYAVRFDYNGNMGSTSDQVLRSLKADGAC